MKTAAIVPLSLNSNSRNAKTHLQWVRTVRTLDLEKTFVYLGRGWWFRVSVPKDNWELNHQPS